ncbi:hypothetical protein AAG570_004034 [Ranatra chinensis]|uniref:Uncharacterized protein n=1 Tax=Ranatra chinensis TaxID=642074 RepID=A0ABD0YPE2_9HEMI
MFKRNKTQETTENVDRGPQSQSVVADNFFSAIRKFIFSLSNMYPNPFERKHSTIRQVIDKLFRHDSGVHPFRKHQSGSGRSSHSTCSHTSKSANSSFKSRSFK